MPRQARDNYAEPRWIEARQHWRLDVRHQGKRKSFYSSNKTRRGITDCRKQAEAWLKSGDRADLKFEDAWKLFLADYKLRNRETSYNQVQSRGKAHLLKTFRHRYLRDITKGEWQQIIYDAFQHGAASKKTLQGIAGIIKLLCRWAAAQGYIEDSAVPLYFAYPAQAGLKPKHILQPDELQALFSPDAEDSWFIHCFRFIVLTGVRRGEFCALKSADFDGNTITILESISHEGIVTGGKTSNAQRTVALTELAQEQIRAHRKLAGIGPYLFMGPDGSYIHPRVLGNHWRKWRDTHGITLTLHELRHTYISYTRLKTDISLDDLKSLYGHADKMNTDKVYVHDIRKTPQELETEKQQALAQAEQINRIFDRLIKTKTDKGGTKGGTDIEPASQVP